jgi:hypothetical protein
MPSADAEMAHEGQAALDRKRCVAAALEYANRGFSVLPLHGIVDGSCTCGKPDCGSPGKHPIGSWKDAQTTRATPEQLEEAFSRYPHANIGIVTGAISGLVVVDIDGPAGMSSCKKVMAGEEPPQGPTVRTGGGHHLYGRHPGTPLKNFVKTHPGLDGRADGGYVVAPPSRHASGREYQWTRPLEDALPELPPKLLALFSGSEGGGKAARAGQRKNNAGAQTPIPEALEPKPRVSAATRQYAETALSAECQIVTMAAIGSQEITLSTAGLKIGRYVGAGLLDFTGARDALVEAGLRMVNDPLRAPWKRDEVRDKIEAKLRKGMESPKWGKDPRGETDDQSPPIDIFGDLALTGVPNFPLDALPSVLKEFVADRAERFGVDAALIAMPALVACAGCLDDKHVVQVRRNDQQWVEAARIWVMVIEEAGGKKTPAINAAMAPLRDIENAWRAEDTEKLQEYELQREVHQAERRHYVNATAIERAFSERPNEPAKPPTRRLVVNDATTEALARILADNPAGVIQLSDELAQFLTSFDAYRSGKAAGRDRTIWLQAYNGGPLGIDRVSSGHLSVSNWSACIIGGIQPERMSKLAPDLSEDGLLQRFMPVFGSGPSRGADRSADEDADRAYRELLQTLVQSRALPAIRFSLSPEAHDIREHLMERAEALLVMPDTPGPLKNHLNKWEALFARLLLTLHVVEVAPVAPLFGRQLGGFREISGETAARVEDLMLNFLLPNAMRFYREFYGREEHVQDACWIAGHILAHRLPYIRERDIYRAYHKLYHEAQALDRATRYLEIAGWIVPMTKDRGRRPTQWWVDPRIHDRFAPRAEQERTRREQDVDRIREAAAKLGRVADQAA